MPPRSMMMLAQMVNSGTMEGFLEAPVDTTYLILEWRFHNNTANGVRARVELGQSTTSGVYTRTGIRIVDQIVNQSSVLVQTDLYIVLTPRWNLVFNTASAELGVSVWGQVLQGVQPLSSGEG